MALVDPAQAERIPIPHEDGQWMAIRPLCAGDLDVLQMQGNKIEVTHNLLAKVITAWSYGDLPQSIDERLDLIRRLDMDTFLWLDKTLGERLARMSGLRSDDEKKDSASKPSPDTATTRSLVNSHTSI